MLLGEDFEKTIDVQGLELGDLDSMFSLRLTSVSISLSG
jgi:hypothetical protein